MRLSGKSLRSLVVLVLLNSTASAQLTEFPLPEPGVVNSIASGPDGNVWFIQHSPGLPRVGRISPDGAVVYFAIDGDHQGGAWDIVAGPDGNLWFTEADDGRGAVLRMTPSGALTRWAVPRDLGLAIPFEITPGPDGNLWLSMATGGGADRGAVGRFKPTGDFTVFPIPALRGGFFDGRPADVAAGPDSNVWFTERYQDQIGRITPAGEVREFPLPAAGSGPGSLTTGPDGNLWFTELAADRIGRITPAGVITEFPVPTRGIEIVAGPDAALWFTQPAPRVGRITTSGQVSEIPLPDRADRIARGPDGSIWLGGAGKIWRLTLSPAHVADVRFLPVVGSTAGVGGAFFRTAVQLHNPTAEPMAGQIVFHRSGVRGGSSSQGRREYLLYPGQTESIPDLLPAMGVSGLGSADIETTYGAVPATTVRVFNDAGESGTTGFTEDAASEGEALSPGRLGVLLLPVDLTSFRFNIGVRTLWQEAVATLTLRDASGMVLANVLRAFSATYHEQQSVTEFLGMTSPPPAGGSISIAVDSGAAFFYGAAVDNVTGDPSFQMARPKR